VTHSVWGHITQLGAAFIKGVKSVAGVDAKHYQIQETLPAEVLKMMHAAPKDESVPVIKPDDLPNADGIAWGMGTRFGGVNASVRGLWDNTGKQWGTGALVGKPTTVFFSTAQQGGGQEETPFTAMPFFVHHGMIYVPIGYSHKGMMNMTETRGGSPWGAGTFSNGDGSRQPSKLELEVAEHHGKLFAETTLALKKGRAAK